MTFKLIILIVNILNVFALLCILIGIPVAKRLQLWYWLRKYGDQIKFQRDTQINLDDFAIERTMPELEQTEFIRCTIQISDTHYLCWKLFEDGIIMNKRPSKSGKSTWLSKEHLELRKKGCVTENEFGIDDNFLDGRRDKIIRLYSLGIVTRWLLHRHADEYYIMAKMGEL